MGNIAVGTERMERLVLCLGFGVGERIRLVRDNQERVPRGCELELMSTWKMSKSKRKRPA